MPVLLNGKVARLDGGAREAMLAAKGPFYFDLTGTIPTDKITYQSNSLQIFDINDNLIYTHTPNMRGRGNTTWAAAKKPYKVRSTGTDARKQRPFYFGESRDWALMADYFDNSYLRTRLAFELARRATGRWAPFSQSGWLTWNGVGKGIYRYSETVDVQVGRVNVRTMQDTDVTGNALTGPYVMEIDDLFDSPGFRTSRNTPVMYDVPSVVGNAAQEAYIQAWMEDLETKLVTDGNEAAVLEKIDLDSWVDWYLVQEYCKNVDADWHKSIKFYKDQDPPNGTGKMVMWAPWDFDRSFGNYGSGGSNGFEIKANATTGDLNDRPNWIYYLWNISPTFRSAVRAKWASTFAPLAVQLLPFVTQSADEIRRWVAADRALWWSGTTRNAVDEPQYLRSFLINRRNWLTTNL